MEILKRFALIVHWGSFVIGILFGGMLLIFSVMPSLEGWGTTSITQRIFFITLGAFVFFSCSGLGWLARFVLVGKIHFLPWKNSND